MMNIILAKNAGLCFGVRRALRLAQHQSRRSKERIYTIGPIIHNPQTVSLLHKTKNIVPEENIEKIKKKSLVVVRSHGISKTLLKKMQEREFDIMDATCPFVKKAQMIVRDLALRNKPTLIIGNKQHPEVVGIKSYAHSDVLIANSLDELKKKKLPKKLNIVCQTTQSFVKLEQILEYLNSKKVETIVFNTICDATMNRQKEAANIAEKVDLMIVIGGRNSSNTKKLVDICRTVNKNTIHIEEDKELDILILKNKKNIGVATGASTPSWIIRRVITKIRRLIKHG